MRGDRIGGLVAAAALLALGGGAALAEDAGAGGDGAGDAYCDFVEGTGAAEAALLVMPELFGSVGYLDRLAVVEAPDPSAKDDLRVTAGIRYSLGDLYQGVLVRRRASADCRRHRALGQVEGESRARALGARARVLDDAVVEAGKILAQAEDDLAARRQTAQDVTATRLRVDGLRRLASDTRRELDGLPRPGPDRALGGALGRYYQADAEVEQTTGSLRRARAWDLSVRVGVDRFASNDDGESPYFAVAAATFDLGWFLQGEANARAAGGRRRLVVTERGGGENLGASGQRMRAILDSERQRLADVGVLLADVERQLETLDRVVTEAGRRYRHSLWFDRVALAAEHAYLESRVASLGAVIGTGAAE